MAKYYFVMAIHYVIRKKIESVEAGCRVFFFPRTQSFLEYLIVDSKLLSNFAQCIE